MSDNERLGEILDAIEVIEEVAQHGRDAFLQSRVLQSAAFYNFIVIGEAIRQLSDALKQAHPEISWQAHMQYRNFMAHAYMHVNAGLAWRRIEHGVPRLKEQLLNISPGQN